MLEQGIIQHSTSQILLPLMFWSEKMMDNGDYVLILEDSINAQLSIDSLFL